MENDAKPAWMADPLVKDIPEQKMRFLEQLFSDGRGKARKR